VGYLQQQLQEASTWRGMVVIATALGMQIAPDKVDAIVAAGLGLSGLLGAMLPDRVRR
jgi:hypothetical protein